MEDVIRIARRENNTKRNYLVVNRFQGKHIPVSPRKALDYFGELAEKVQKKYSGESLFFIGFAETATAIGSVLAIELNSLYLQTTREEIPGVNYLFFSEDHSHAAQQKLVLEDLKAGMEETERIVFVEDELTTGNTILHAISAIKSHTVKPMKFSVASLLNGMDEEALVRFEQNQVDVIDLQKTNPDTYSEIARQAGGDGQYERCSEEVNKEKLSFSCLKVRGGLNARRLVKGEEYQKACEHLWEKIKERREKKGRILVVGTEEFMFPALYVAEKMEKEGKEVKFHATTRSPIVVSTEPEYPLCRRAELISMYEEARITYLYNIESYEEVWIITDSSCLCSKGVQTLLHALAACENHEIHLVQWMT